MFAEDCVAASVWVFEALRFAHAGGIARDGTVHGTPRRAPLNSRALECLRDESSRANAWRLMWFAC